MRKFTLKKMIPTAFVVVGASINSIAAYIAISHAFLNNPIHINKALLLLTFGCLSLTIGLGLNKKKCK